MGDSIVGLQALRIALDVTAIPPDPVLFRLPGLATIVQAVYAAASFCETRDLDWDVVTPEHPVPEAAQFGKLLDLRDFAFDPAFRGVAMIDFFLERLGVDPPAIPAERRRNTWLAGCVVPEPPPIHDYVLVCPTASMSLRTMPETVHAALLSRLATLGVRAADIPYSSLAGLCGWVAGAGLIVTTDTAIVHLADAFSVPCVAVFTTHRPEWRARDYPLCRALYRPPAGLPPALEFSRGPEDEAAAHAAWLDAGDAKWLTDAVTEAVADAGGRLVQFGRT